MPSYLFYILGLQVNLYKSMIVRVEIDMGKIQHLASALGSQIGNLLMKYLGLQLGVRMRCTQGWNRVLESVRS